MSSSFFDGTRGTPTSTDQTPGTPTSTQRTQGTPTHTPTTPGTRSTASFTPGTPALAGDIYVDSGRVVGQELILNLTNGGTVTIDVNSLQGVQGERGPRGETGMQGPAGDPGPIGPTGNPGPEGPAGPAGGPGPQGMTGMTGPIGPNGVSVTSGAVNADGDLVLTLSDTTTVNVGSVVGPQGMTGMTGPAGAQGNPGPQGNPGTTGTPGTDGRGIDDITAPANIALGQPTPITISYTDNTPDTTINIPSGSTGARGAAGDDAREFVSGSVTTNADGTPIALRLTDTDGTNLDTPLTEIVDYIASQERDDNRFIQSGNYNANTGNLTLTYNGMFPDLVINVPTGASTNWLNEGDTDTVLPERITIDSDTGLQIVADGTSTTNFVIQSIPPFTAFSVSIQRVPNYSIFDTGSLSSRISVSGGTGQVINSLEVDGTALPIPGFNTSFTFARPTTVGAHTIMVGATGENSDETPGTSTRTQQFDVFVPYYYSVGSQPTALTQMTESNDAFSTGDSFPVSATDNANIYVATRRTDPEFTAGVFPLTGSNVGTLSRDGQDGVTYTYNIFNLGPATSTTTINVVAI